MDCKNFELTRRQRSRINTIAVDFVLYNSDKIKKSYEDDNFFEVLSGEIEDSVKYFKEKFPEIPQWVFWELFFNRLNQEFAKIE